MKTYVAVAEFLLQEEQVFLQVGTEYFERLNPYRKVPPA